MHAAEGAIEVRTSRADDAKVASGGDLRGKEGSAGTIGLGTIFQLMERLVTCR